MLGTMLCLQASSRFGETKVVGWIFSAHQECEGLLPTIRFTRTFKGVPVSLFFSHGLVQPPTSFT